MSCYNSTVSGSSPQNIVVKSVNPASLMVKFQQPSLIDRNGEISGYVIQYTRVGSQIVTSETVASGTTHTISGLLAYVNYSISVAAVNINGTGRSSNPVVQRSGQDSESSVIIKYMVVAIVGINMKIYSFSIFVHLKTTLEDGLTGKSNLYMHMCTAVILLQFIPANIKL